MAKLNKSVRSLTKTGLFVVIAGLGAWILFSYRDVIAAGVGARITGGAAGVGTSGLTGDGAGETVGPNTGADASTPNNATPNGGAGGRLPIVTVLTNAGRTLATTAQQTRTNPPLSTADRAALHNYGAGTSSFLRTVGIQRLQTPSDGLLNSIAAFAERDRLLRPTAAESAAARQRASDRGFGAAPGTYALATSAEQATERAGAYTGNVPPALAGYFGRAREAVGSVNRPGAQQRAATGAAAARAGQRGSRSYQEQREAATQAAVRSPAAQEILRRAALGRNR